MLALNLSVLLVLSKLIGGILEPFDAFDRKEFKRRKLRYAAFDEQGILTLDGALNGKSNEITYLNTESSETRQELCKKESKLMFRLCEKQKLGAWSGLAICYESQLSQRDINPAFRVHAHEDYRRLVKVLCGRRQNAILINRVGVERRQDGQLQLVNSSRLGAQQKYEPIYAIWTSFSPAKYYFQMPNANTEKQCALLQLGGKRVLNLNVTSLRRERLSVYEEDGTSTSSGLLRVIDPAKNASFPDMQNRGNTFDAKKHLGFLMLDFSPPFLRMQNISVFGWLPLEIKITGHALAPCAIGWRFLESREVRGTSIRAEALEIKYVMDIGLSQGGQSKRGSTAKEGKSEQTEKSKGYRGSVSVTLPKIPVTVGMEGGLNFENTFGFQQDHNAFISLMKDLRRMRKETRVETVRFNNFDGEVSVEQAVYGCNGVEYRLDKLRYRDPGGMELEPDQVLKKGIEGADLAEEVANVKLPNDGEVAVPLPEAAQEVPILDSEDSCIDVNRQCKVWARRGHCKGQKTMNFMLTRCKFSCGLCKTVGVKAMDVERDKGEKPKP